MRQGVDPEGPAPRSSIAPPDRVLPDAVARGVARLASLQDPDGAWRCDYGGPMFLLPMYVAANHIADRQIPAARRERMVAYLSAVQRDDGSFGLHAEADRGSMFTSSLCYVAMRMMGVAPDAPRAASLRRWILANGTALSSASWGKFVLALLNLYDYDGLHSLPPEPWLLPRAAPIHPGRLWCHCRQVYLPMAYLYGQRARIPADGLLRQLRSELYDRPYHEIRFADHRDSLCPLDRLAPPSPLMSAVNRLLDLHERLHVGSLRARALRLLADHMDYEDRATHFIRIGPVNAALNSIARHFADPGSPAAIRGFERLDEYIWEGHDGDKMNGYNSTALWDTAFAAQAILASGLALDHRRCLRRAHAFIRDNQIVEELPAPEGHHRHRSRGGWPFSDRAHGWPITDCTAEGFKSALGLADVAIRPIPDDLLAASVELMLSLQNRDGGWATYERQRGGAWLELLNPSQVFHKIMVDYSYVECTSACIQALGQARTRFPVLGDEIQRAIRRGERFIRKRQRPDGSWEGSWAVCFTYGTWFAVTGLLAAGADSSDRAIRRACDFLERRQGRDGGWGEHHSSCLERTYVPLAGGHVVNTAWALLTLVRGGRGRTVSARRAADFLIGTQRPDGDWPRQSMVGVFNRTTMINYDNYRRYFPVWALAELARA